ncbi:MAG: DUF4384 domain-containing protein [Desulfomonilaceae bacterium]
MASLTKSTGFLRSLVFISLLVCSIMAADSELVTAQQSRSGASASTDSMLAPKTGELEDGDQPEIIKVSLEVDKPVVQAEQPVTVTATVERDCYLNIIHVGRKGKMTFLWPNKESGWESRASGNTPLRIPGPGSDFRLQFDGSSPEEHIVAIASEAEGPLLNARDLQKLPGSKLKSLSKDPMDFLDDVWEKLTQAEKQAGWGAAELFLQVGERSDKDEGKRADIRSKVTLHVFSGVADPSWYLSREQEAALQKLIGSAKSLPVAQSETVPPDLGYRGFSLEGLQDTDLRGKVLIFSDNFEVDSKKSFTLKSDINLERWLLDSAGDALSPETKSFVLKLMKTAGQSPSGTSSEEQEDLQESEPDDERDVTDMLRDSETQIQPLSFSEKAPAAHRFIMRPPVYEPQKWNAPKTRPHNNCYNYSTNMPTNTFAQPGRYSGRPILGRITCEKVKRAAISDGLIPCLPKRRSKGDEESSATDLLTKTTDVTGHLVAMVAAPGLDYHWLRLDNNGYWSHKPGQTAVTDKDNRGRKIADPRLWKKYQKMYTQFCGFFFVPTNIRVKDEAVSLRRTSESYER